MLTSRRNFITGLVAAPAVLRLGIHMPVKKIITELPNNHLEVMVRNGSLEAYHAARKLIDDFITGTGRTANMKFVNEDGKDADYMFHYRYKERECIITGTRTELDLTKTYPSIIA